MSIQKFKNGTILVTGDDIYDYIMKSHNKRNNYKKECSFCLHNGNILHEDICGCGDCSLETGDMACSCHINPPCSKCTESLFEVSPYLINYKHFEKGKSPWECYRGDKQTFDKLTRIESQGFYANAETLITNEIAIYISKVNKEEEDIEICKKIEFKSAMSKFINNFDISL